MERLLLEGHNHNHSDGAVRLSTIQTEPEPCQSDLTYGKENGLTSPAEVRHLCSIISSLLPEDLSHGTDRNPQIKHNVCMATGCDLANHRDGNT